MHSEKFYFGTQNGCLAICHIGPWRSSSMSLRNSSCNMAAPLPTCTVEEQRRVIRFLWSEGVKPSEIYRRMKVQYRDSCLSQGRVYEWVERFQNGRQNVSESVCRWQRGNGGGAKLVNPLNAELNPICYLLALLRAHNFLHVSRIRVKSLTLRLLMSYMYIYGAHILDVSRSHTTTHHSR